MDDASNSNTNGYGCRRGRRESDGERGARVEWKGRASAERGGRRSEGVRGQRGRVQLALALFEKSALCCFACLGVGEAQQEEVHALHDTEEIELAVQS
jgi:hypothetical protein